MLVVEIKLDFLRVSVNFGEINYKISSHSKLQPSVSDFVPTALNNVPNMDLYFRRRLSWMVSSALEANTFEDKFFVKFNFDP